MLNMNTQPVLIFRDMVVYNKYFHFLNLVKGLGCFRFINQKQRRFAMVRSSTHPTSLKAAARLGQRDFRSESSYLVVHTLYVPTRGACRCADCVWLFCLRWVVVSPPSLCLAAFSRLPMRCLTFCLVSCVFRFVSLFFRVVVVFGWFCSVSWFGVVRFVFYFSCLILV